MFLGIISIRKQFYRFNSSPTRFLIWNSGAEHLIIVKTMSFIVWCCRFCTHSPFFSMQLLVLYSNSLSGSIPSQLGLLTNITVFLLHAYLQLHAPSSISIDHFWSAIDVEFQSINRTNSKSIGFFNQRRGDRFILKKFPVHWVIWLSFFWTQYNVLFYSISSLVRTGVLFVFQFAIRVNSIPTGIFDCDAGDLWLSCWLSFHQLHYCEAWKFVHPRVLVPFNSGFLAVFKQIVGNYSLCSGAVDQYSGLFFQSFNK